jgi:tRNA(Arg) A34 adenosine deaminase TadA
MLSNRQQAWLDLATRLAEDSTCRMQHGAVIVRGSSVLGMGTNRFRNHPKWIDDYDHCSRHAEIVALRRVIGRSEYVDLSKAVVYVARVAAGGRLALSRPCDACWQALHKAGLRTVIFTTTDGGILERW